MGYLKREKIKKNWENTSELKFMIFVSFMYFDSFWVTPFFMIL